MNSEIKSDFWSGVIVVKCHVIFRWWQNSYALCKNSCEIVMVMLNKRVWADFEISEVTRPSLPKKKQSEVTPMVVETILHFPKEFTLYIALVELSRMICLYTTIRVMIRRYGIIKWAKNELKWALFEKVEKVYLLRNFKFLYNEYQGAIFTLEKSILVFQIRIIRRILDHIGTYDYKL